MVLISRFEQLKEILEIPENSIVKINLNNSNYFSGPGKTNKGAKLVTSTTSVNVFQPLCWTRNKAIDLMN